jgi:hypothetical protein
MLSIVTEPTNDDSTHVTVEFNGDFDELINATDAVLVDLTDCLIQSCPEDEVNTIAMIFLDRFAHCMAKAVTKKLDGELPNDEEE